MYNVHCTLYTIYCKLYIVHHTLYTTLKQLRVRVQVGRWMNYRGTRDTWQASQGFASHKALSPKNKYKFFSTFSLYFFFFIIKNVTSDLSGLQLSILLGLCAELTGLGGWELPLGRVRSVVKGGDTARSGDQSRLSGDGEGVTLDLESS